MSLTVATKTFEVNGVLHPAERGPVDRVARLVGAPVDAKAPAAEPQHLRHEGQRVERAALVERAEDLLRRADLDHVADP